MMVMTSPRDYRGYGGPLIAENKGDPQAAFITEVLNLLVSAN